MTATAETARLALVYDAMIRKGIVTKVDLPKFKRLGHGAYRVVYLHEASGMVYKVPRDYSRMDSEVSRSEHQNSLYVQRQLNYDGVAINFPDTELFDFGIDAVLAMPYVEGDFTICGSYYGEGCTCDMSPCHEDVRQYAGDMSGLADMHGENVLFDGKQYFVIDMGS